MIMSYATKHSTSKIEQNILMITILVSTKGIIVIYNMYTIGLDYSYTCIIQQLEIKYHLSKEAKLS